MIANPDGFGFLRPDTGGGDDLFLPPYEMRKVMHGDRALANVTGIDRRGRREGSIARVLERGMTRLIGRFSVEMGINYVVPDDKRIQRNVQVPPDQTGGANDGQLVVCEVMRSEGAQLGVEFETPLVSDGAGGLCTRHRVSPCALAAAGMPLTSFAAGGATPLGQQAPSSPPQFMQVQVGSGG